MEVPSGQCPSPVSYTHLKHSRGDEGGGLCSPVIMVEEGVRFQIFADLIRVLQLPVREIVDQLVHGFRLDVYKRQVQADGENINLPHTWNAIDGQDGGNDYYRGSCWYVKELGKLEISDDDEAWLEFEGVSMSAEVYVNCLLYTSYIPGSF